MEAITKFEIHCGSDINQAMMLINKTFQTGHHIKFASDHIFDEDRSVKWNREEVNKQNQIIQEKRELTLAAKNKSYANLDEEIYKYIMEESVYNRRFTYNEAKVIWQQTIIHHDSNPWDWVDEMAETMHEFIIAQETKDEN